jgi:tRNA(Ile)-lysidine synthase
MDAFLTQIVDFIAKQDLLPKDCPVVAGVSGGADSLALLLLLDRLRVPFGLTLTIAHLNHGLRGGDADGDEAFVRDWCNRLGLNFVSRLADIGQLAASAGLGLEDAGRQARLSFFNELADQIDSGSNGRPPTRIALGHHLNDQAETLLLHLGRGCGLDGLTGMKPVAGRLIRPLLAQPRRSIEAWLSSQGIAWRQDDSNLHAFALRNRLQVLPAWETALGYDPAPLLARTASSLAEDQLLLADLTKSAADRCRVGEGLAASVLLELDPALQSRLLRLFWQERTSSCRDLSFTHIRLLRDFLQQAPAGRQLCLPGNWRARREGPLLLIDPFVSGLSVQNEAGESCGRLTGPIPLVLPGRTSIPQMKLQITAVLIENESDIVYNSTMEYFHLDRIAGSVIRHRQPGDYIHPFGRTGGKTLKKFLNEQKIRSQDRDKLLLVAREKDIVWLPGQASGAGFTGRPGDGGTRPLICLKIEPADCE